MAEGRSAMPFIGVESLRMLTPSAKETARLTVFAALLVPAWLVACGLGRRYDARITIAAAAIGLGILAIATLPGILRPLFRINAGALAIGAGAGAVMTAATTVLFPIVCRILPGTHAEVYRLYHQMHIPRPSPDVLTILTLIIIGEEILWRGVFFEALQRRIGRGASVVIGSIVYGLAHLPLGSPLLAAVAILCGIYWCTLRAGTGSILPSLISHIIWDIAIVAHPLVR